MLLFFGLLIFAWLTPHVANIAIKIANLSVLLHLV